MIRPSDMIQSEFEPKYYGNVAKRAIILTMEATAYISVYLLVVVREDPTLTEWNSSNRDVQP